MSTICVGHSFGDKVRTGDVLISENVDFAGLLLSDAVLSGLKKAGFERPSPIQLKAVPLGRCGLDLIVQAKSGTGKTCVFTVVALESLELESSATQVLVLAPTREIANQSWEVISSIGCEMPALRCHTFIGGLPVHEDKEKLKKCHIAVGTPGRIKQLIEINHLKTDNIRLFILDEADKLLEESFQETINWIYSSLPDNKQMLALSATYPEYLAQHLTAYMRNPTFLRLNVTDPALLGIKQYYRTVPFCPLPHKVFKDKLHVVVELLSSVDFQQCLIFSNLQTRAQNMADALSAQGWPTACIAGSYDQKLRNEAMARLKTYKCRVLISTDLSSRGIDAEKVDVVVNLDIPKDHETYLHRIGRAGRFGAFGAAVTVVSEGQEVMALKSVELKCNTHILPLPAPIPMDLVKQKVKLQLSEIVTAEQLNTDRAREKKSDRSATEHKKSNGAESELPLVTEHVPQPVTEHVPLNVAEHEPPPAFEQTPPLLAEHVPPPTVEKLNLTNPVCVTDEMNLSVKENLFQAEVNSQPDELQQPGEISDSNMENCGHHSPSLSDKSAEKSEYKENRVKMRSPDQHILPESSEKYYGLDITPSDSALTGFTGEPNMPVEDDIEFPGNRKDFGRRQIDLEQVSQSLKIESAIELSLQGEERDTSAIPSSEALKYSGSGLPPQFLHGAEHQTHVRSVGFNSKKKVPRSRRSKIHKHDPWIDASNQSRSNRSSQEKIQHEESMNRDHNGGQRASPSFDRSRLQVERQILLPRFEDVIGYRSCGDGHTYATALDDYENYLRRESPPTSPAPPLRQILHKDSGYSKKMVESISQLLNNIGFDTSPKQVFEQKNVRVNAILPENDVEHVSGKMEALGQELQMAELTSVCDAVQPKVVVETSTRDSRRQETMFSDGYIETDLTNNNIRYGDFKGEGLSLQDSKSSFSDQADREIHSEALKITSQGTTKNSASDHRQDDLFTSVTVDKPEMYPSLLKSKLVRNYATKDEPIDRNSDNKPTNIIPPDDSESSDSDTSQDDSEVDETESTYYKYWDDGEFFNTTNSDYWQSYYHASTNHDSVPQPFPHHSIPGPIAGSFPLYTCHHPCPFHPSPSAYVPYFPHHLYGWPGQGQVPPYYTCETSETEFMYNTYLAQSNYLKMMSAK